jgi:hypothetical protein
MAITKESSVILYKLATCFPSPYPAILSLFHPPPTMDELDASPVIFDPNSLMTTNHIIFLFSCWASLDPSQPVNILSRFKVETISHHKLPSSPEHEFLVIKTVDPHDKSYRFILERRPSEMTAVTPVVDPIPYRTRLFNKVKKLMATLGNFIVPNESFAFDSLSIGDKTTLSLVQTTDLMLDSMDKSGNDTLAVDRFLGQNYLSSPRYHGQVVAHFKPHELSLFKLVLLSHVVHEMHQTYAIFSQQCYFYASLVYTATQQIFGISPSKSADENQDLPEYNIDSHFTGAFKHGRWKGVLVTLVDQDEVSNVERAYKVAYLAQVAKVSFIYL